MPLLFRGKLSRSRHRRARHTTRVYRVSNASIREHTRKTSSRGRSTPAACVIYWYNYELAYGPLGGGVGRGRGVGVDLGGTVAVGVAVAVAVAVALAAAVAVAVAVAVAEGVPVGVGLGLPQGVIM